jgi:hypothetical protein
MLLQFLISSQDSNLGYYIDFLEVNKSLTPIISSISIYVPTLHKICFYVSSLVSEFLSGVLSSADVDKLSCHVIFLELSLAAPEFPATLSNDLRQQSAPRIPP